MAIWNYPTDPATETKYIPDPSKIALPRGVYTCKVLAVTDVVEPGTAFPYMTIKFEVKYDPRFTGRVFWHTVLYAPVGTPLHGLMIHSLTALRIPCDGAVNFDTQSLVNRLVRCVVGCRTMVKSNVSYGVNYIENFITDKYAEDSFLPPVPNPEPDTRDNLAAQSPGLSYDIVKDIQGKL